VYQKAGCFVLPSISEPWGLAVNEAIAAGTPVLVSDRCGCAPDLVRPGENRFIFSPMNVKELIGLMEEITAMSAVGRIEMGRCGQKIVASFTPVVWAQNFLDLADHCTERRTGAKSLSASRSSVLKMPPPHKTFPAFRAIRRTRVRIKCK